MKKTALVVAQMKFEYARNYMQLPHNKTVSPKQLRVQRIHNSSKTNCDVKCGFECKIFAQWNCEHNGHLDKIWTVRIVMSCHGLLWAVDLITPNFDHCGFSSRIFAHTPSPKEKRLHSSTVRAWRLEVSIAWGGQSRGRPHGAITRGVGCVTRHCHVAIILGRHRLLHCFLPWKTDGKQVGRDWKTNKQNVGKHWEHVGKLCTVAKLQNSNHQSTS